MASHSAFFTKIDNQDENYFPITETFRANNGHAMVKTHEIYDSKINDVYRRTLTHLQSNLVADKMKNFLDNTAPGIHDQVEKRSKILIDYDSYRRRLKSLRDKKASLESSGKGNSSAAQDNLAEIGKFEAKEKNMKEALDIKTQTILDDINTSRVEYEDQMETAIITMVATQYELYRRMADDLENALSFFPQEKVQRIRESFDVMVSQNGPPVTAKKESKGFFSRGPEKTEKEKEEEKKRKEEEKRRKEEEKERKKNESAGAVSVNSSESDPTIEKTAAFSPSPYSPPEPRSSPPLSPELPIATPIAPPIAPPSSISSGSTSVSTYDSTPVPPIAESPSAPPTFEVPPSSQKQVLKLVRALYDHIVSIL